MGNRQEEPIDYRDDVVSLIDEYESEELLRPSLTGGVRTGPGRKTTARGIARKRVAMQMGLSERTVAEIDRVSKRKKEKARRDVIKHMGKFEDFGLELDRAWLAQVSAVASALRLAELRINSAATVLTHVRNSGNVAVNDESMKREIDMLKGRGEMLRRLMPRSLCPFCKGQPAVQEACKHCHQTGWVGKLKFVPAELLEREPLRIHVDGEVVTLGEEPAAPEAEEVDW